MSEALVLPVRPFVSIVVPCRNEVEHIHPLLDSILANEYPSDRLEVLVVDGLSDDGTRAVVADYARRYPMIHVLDNPKRTTPHALNLGITRARGAIIMRMDAHAHYPPNYVARSEEHTSELQSLTNLVCRLLLEKKNKNDKPTFSMSLSHCIHQTLNSKASTRFHSGGLQQS